MDPLKTQYAAGEVARCLVKIANDQVVDRNPETGETVYEGITNLKLQKILYFAQAAHLALCDKPLFEDEIQAWKYGPVVPSVYNIFKQYNADFIPASDGDCVDDKLHDFLMEVWDIFGKYSTAELVHLSHQHDPYKDVYSDTLRNIVISPESMKKFYKTMFRTK